MCRRITLIILFLFLITAGAFAETFTVTSNAVSGPGTLREALTKAAANGSAEKDYIYFNLPGAGDIGRTITLITNLPNMSSNLVVDGTTQKGNVFGQSDAKVKISTPTHEKDLTPYSIFNGQSLSNVEIYGIYLYDFSDPNTSFPDLKERTGITFKDCSNIIIGSPNKGNLINGFRTYSLNIEATDVIKVQSNIIGINQFNINGNEGQDRGGGYTAVMNFYKCDHLTIGGESNNGNCFFTGMNLKFYEKTKADIIIEGNNFGVFRDGLTVYNWFSGFNGKIVDVSTIFSNDTKTNEEAKENEAIPNIFFKNNLTGYGEFLNARFINGNITLHGNYFGVTRGGQSELVNTHPLSIPFIIDSSSAQFNIGSDDFAERNFFHGMSTVVYAGMTPNIFIRGNDFRCVNVTVYSNQSLSTYTIPNVEIEKVTSNSNHTIASGTSTPNAIIDIYSSESCQSNCSIRKYLQSVTSDNEGKWQADILNLSGIFYVAATLSNQTSEYKSFGVNSDNIQIKPLRCNGFGEIIGLKIPEGLSYYWMDESGTIVSHDLNLKTKKPGKYQLILGDGCIKSDFFEIKDDNLIVDGSSLSKGYPSCGVADGYIRYLTLYDPEDKIKSIEWSNDVGTVVGNTLNVENLPAGNYKLRVLTNDGCEANYGPVSLKDATGLNIGQNGQISPTKCGQAVGAITGIVVTGGSGTLRYVWTNSQRQQVGSTKDLINQPAGSYKLQVTDDSQCGPVYSTDIIIPETNGITLDESKAVRTIASCGENNGTVTGIMASGATKYQWTDANGKTVSSTAELTGVPSGDYTLIVSNNFGCSKTSQTYHIDQQAVTQFPQYAANIVSACFHGQDGSITVTTDGLVKNLRWVDAAGGPIGTAAGIQNLVPGKYTLYLTDQNGCEQLYNTYTVGEEPEYTVASYGEKADDQCGLKTGSISNVTIAGGVPPYTYKWTDAAGNIIGTGNSIASLAAGDYKLNVMDTRCGNVDITYTINAVSADVAPPSVADVQLCSSGSALLTVNNASLSTIYRLYETSSSSNVIDEKTGGHFNVTVGGNRSYFISQLNGTCESSRAEVKVSVGLSVVDIANTFTPNGDGINDSWQIKSIGSYPSSIVQVFTRYGDKVFESKGYGKPFDGTTNSKQLPAGIYYYIINLNTNCNLLSGSLTIIR